MPVWGESFFSAAGSPISPIFSLFPSLSFRFCFLQHSEVPVQDDIRIPTLCLALQRPRCAFRGNFMDLTRMMLQICARPMRIPTWTKV
jgi:hypothetical protein